MDKELLYRFFAGEATVEEKEQIRAWAESSSDNMQLLFNERKLYNAILIHGNVDNQVRSERKPAMIKHLNPWLSLCKYAAVFVIGVLLTWGAGYWYTVQQVDELQIVVPRGQYLNFTLADGSNVYLNSGTTLKYPSRFVGKARKVQIDGEGFFEVIHQKNNTPFIVETSKGNIEVLGTKFNVEAYNDKDKFVTSLQEGSVKVTSADASVVLKPNEYATIQNGELTKEVLKDKSCYSWTQGLLDFKNVTFEEVLQEFEKAYGVDIILNNDKVKSCMCYGKFRRIDGLEYALRVLQVDIPFTYMYDVEKQVMYINE